MMDQTLFPEVPENHPDKPLPHNGTTTSKLAAETMKPFATSQEIRVFEFIKERDDYGATDEEQQLSLGMTGNSQRPRRRRLVERGLVADSKTTRKTSSGSDAIVWVAVSPDQPPVADSKANWPTGGKSNPNKSDSAEFVPDFAI